MPPVAVLDDAALLLQKADPELFSHLAACAQSEFTDSTISDGSTEEDRRTAPASAVIWRLLCTLLSEALSHRAWLVLWDHLVASQSKPDLLAASAVSLLRKKRQALLALPPGCSPVDLDAELQRPLRSINAVRNLIGEAEMLLSKHRTATTSKTRQIAVETLPRLPKGVTYPPLLGPNFAVDPAVSEHAHIHAEMPPGTSLQQPRFVAEELTTRLEQGKERLADTERRMQSCTLALARERSAYQLRIAEHGERVAEIRAQLREEANAAGQARSERLDRGIASNASRGHELLTAERQELARHLEASRAQHASRAEQSLQQQTLLGLEQQATLHILDQLREHSTAHISLPTVAAATAASCSTIEESWAQPFGREGAVAENGMCQRWGGAQSRFQNGPCHESVNAAPADLELETLERDLRMGRLARVQASRRGVAGRQSRWRNL